MITRIHSIYSTIYVFFKRKLVLETFGEQNKQTLFFRV
jgi:hypothetical protein